MVGTERTIYDDLHKCEITYYRWRCKYCGYNVGWDLMHSDWMEKVRYKREPPSSKNTYELALRDRETCEPCHHIHAALGCKEW